MTDEMLVRAAIRDELSGPLERIRDELRGVGNEADRAARKANIGARGFDRMAGGAARFVKLGVGAAARSAAVGVGILVSAATVGSYKMLNMASDAAETASAFGTVFKGVSGDVAGYVDRMNKRFGITTAELQTAATTFGVFGKAAGVAKGDLGGFTKDLVGAGLDLASFYNADPTEVFQALRSGLAGEAEPLRQFGIFLSDAAMKSKAATMGLTGELTESQKVMVRQAIIMESLGDAQGDMARTSDGLANKTKALKGRLTEAGTAIGTALLPYAERAANALDARLGPAVERLPGQLKAAERTVKDYVGAWQTGGMDGVVAKLDAQVGAGGRLEAAWDKAEAIAQDLTTIVRDGVAPAFSDVASVLPGVLSPMTLLDDVLGFLADNTDLVRVALTGYVAVVTLAKAATIAHTAATMAGTALTTARVATTALLTGTIALNTGATLTNTQANIAAGIIRARMIAMTIAHTAATVAGTVASKVARGATLAWSAAQWLLNAALTANPVGLVIAAIAALVAGVVIAYKKSDTFRGIVDGLWAAIKTAATWVWDLAKKVGELVLKWTPMGRLLKLGIDNFGKIRDAIGRVVDKVNDLIGAIGNIDWPEPPGWMKDVAGGIGGLLGDTATSRARGGGALGSTMAAHAQATAATGARPTITNALVGGGGRGRGSGDHQRGRALDLTGKGLARYGRYIRAQGGYAAFHGSGSTRHLHAVPAAAGDTVHSRARSRSTVSAGGGGVTIEAGAVTVTVTNPSSNVDVAEAVAQGIRDYVRDREERG